MYEIAYLRVLGKRIVKVFDNVNDIVKFDLEATIEKGRYYENRNRNVLVLCPKKLTDNWNTFKSNYKNNPIAAQIAGVTITTTLDDAIADSLERKCIEREITALEKKVQNEKQFNRQVELNGELKRLRAESEELG